MNFQTMSVTSCYPGPPRPKRGGRTGRTPADGGAAKPTPGRRRLHNAFVHRHDLLTAPIAATGLVAGYAVAVVSGSRPFGGAVLAAFGVCCMGIWIRRDGALTAAKLTLIGLLAFAVSHVGGLLIGPWPAVLLAAAGVGIASWRMSDARRPGVTSFASGR
jgi:hypothetical protein